MAEDKKNLPSLQDLSLDIEQAYKADQFKLLLNQQPPEKWLKKNTAGGSKFPYMPIDKIEFLLDRIFQEWRCEVLREGVMFNSVFCTVRIHYKNPVTGEWSYHDGVGAKDIQHDADTTLDMTTIKAAGVQMALPSAKSYAVKDACDHLGILFGRNVGRKDTIAFEGAYSRKPRPMDKSDERLINMINASTSLQQLQKFERDIPEDKPEVQNAYNIKFAELDK